MRSSRRHRTRTASRNAAGRNAAAPKQQAPTQFGPNLQRLQGDDTTENTRYTLLVVLANKPPATLTAQCSSTPAGPAHFELFVDFDPKAAPAFRTHRARLPTEPMAVYAPLLLDVRGYTHVKPFRREFEVLRTGDRRYNPPGLHSHNLEEASWLLQYLRALPTLIVTDVAHPELSATFETTPLLAQLRKEPLCKASGL